MYLLRRFSLCMSSCFLSFLTPGCSSKPYKAPKHIPQERKKLFIKVSPLLPAAKSKVSTAEQKAKMSIIEKQLEACFLVTQSQHMDVAVKFSKCVSHTLASCAAGQPRFHTREHLRMQLLKALLLLIFKKKKVVWVNVWVMQGMIYIFLNCIYFQHFK